MFGSASIIATAPSGPTVVPYRWSVGPRGFVGAAARPGGRNRTTGAVRSWEKMFAATIASYLGSAGVRVGAASPWASAGMANGAARAAGRGEGARRRPKPATRSAAVTTYRPRTAVTSRSRRPPRRRARAGGATRTSTGTAWRRADRRAGRGPDRPVARRSGRRARRPRHSTTIPRRRAASRLARAGTGNPRARRSPPDTGAAPGLRAGRAGRDVVDSRRRHG